MSFSYLLVIIIFLIIIDNTEPVVSSDQKCFSTVQFNTYSTILRDIFMNFSTSYEAHIIRNKLSKANISDDCFIRSSIDVSSFRKSNSSFELFSSLTNAIVIPYCIKTIVQSPVVSQYKLSSYKIWVYGFISVTVINACAGLGILFIPMMKKKLYKVVMTFMISLAVGSLTGSALLILIPDAMQLSELQESSPGSHINYQYRATVVFGGLYMFFLLERFLKWIINKKVQKYSDKKTFSHGSMNVSRVPKQKLEAENLSTDIQSMSLPENKDGLNNHSKEHLEENMELSDHCDTDLPVVNIKNSRKKIIAPVAWMIIFGDALHNFIDGLSIGAAFSRNPMTGVSLSIAVLCEELPHELGDFAILLNAGMSVKQALMWNMLSAATCYMGFIIGVVLGELTSGSIWVFAVAGGMFLYISLVDMMPEMNEMLENKENVEIVNFGILNTFIIQNIGLLIGYCLLLLMALYGDKIKID